MPLRFVTASLATAFILITDLRIHCPALLDPTIVESKVNLLTKEKSKIWLIVFGWMVEVGWMFHFKICRRWSCQARFAVLTKLPSQTARKSSRYKFKITGSLFARELSNTNRVVLVVFIFHFYFFVIQRRRTRAVSASRRNLEKRKHGINGTRCV